MRRGRTTPTLLMTMTFPPCVSPPFLVAGLTRLGSSTVNAVTITPSPPSVRGSPVIVGRLARGGCVSLPQAAARGREEVGQARHGRTGLHGSVSFQRIGLTRKWPNNDVKVEAGEPALHLGVQVSLHPSPVTWQVYRNPRTPWLWPRHRLTLIFIPLFPSHISSFLCHRSRQDRLVC